MTFLVAVITFVGLAIAKGTGNYPDMSFWFVTAPLWVWGSAAVIVGAEAAFWRWLMPNRQGPYGRDL